MSNILAKSFGKGYTVCGKEYALTEKGAMIHMKKIIPLLLLACLLIGCTANEPAATTSPVPETTIPVTEPEVFVEAEVTLEAVNKHSFYKSGESPSVGVLDARTVAYVTTEYINKDFSKKYTRIRLVDLHMDVQRGEQLLEGTYSLLPHCGAQGVLALVDQDSDEILVLDKSLEEVLTFRARTREGVLTEDLGSYYYVWGSKLYRLDTATGEDKLCEAGQELLLDEIWGYDPSEKLLLVSAFEDSYTTKLCMVSLNLENGSYNLMYRGISAGKFAAGGVILENKHQDLLSADLYFGHWQDAELGILMDFLPNNKDFASWHIAGSDYLCRAAYDSGGVDIVEFQLYRLGETPEVCSLQSVLKGAKINGTYALPDGNILMMAVSSRGYQTWLICPDKLEFAPAELEIGLGDPLVDSTILENYEKEPVFDLPEEMSGVREMADRLEETYGLTILLSNQCALAASYCSMPITTTDDAGLYNEVSSIEEALKRLEEVLTMYPEDFFRQFRNEGGEKGLLILLVENISADLNVIGVSYTMGQWYPVAIDITSGQVKSTYCHEFWHATENRIGDLDESALDLAAWEDLNPAGFRYPGEAKEGYWEDTQYTYFYGNPGEEVYFVDPYGKTNAKEDRARLMEYIMCADWEAEQMVKHPVLKAKLQLMCDAIREVFDTSAWKDVRWERFSE